MADTIYDSIYPLTVVADRYSGVYSGGDFTAWNLEPWEVPEAVFGGDVECMGFWEGDDGDVFEGRIRSDIVCGVGNTPDEAIGNLYIRLRRADNEDNKGQFFYI